MNYKKIKRAEYDKCNICGQQSKLTWDHVPPKCCNNRYSIKANSWINGLPKDNFYGQQYQNGIRYRSLCNECNNGLLGTKFDVVLADFTKQVTDKMISSEVLPPVFRISVKINRLCRAICGHFLAAKNIYDEDYLIDAKLRRYVLDVEALPPENMSLMYWVYPYDTICLVRDVSVKSYSKKYVFPQGLISMMNSYPVAYLLSSEKEEECGLFDLFKYSTSDIDAVVDVPIECVSCYFPNTNRMRSFLWPCYVSDREDGASFMLGNGECMNDSKIAKHSLNTIEKIRKKELTVDN